MFLASAAAVPQVAAGKLRALAVTGPARLGVLQDVPTMVESGYPQLVIRDWQGLIVKAGTPAAVVARLNAELNRAMRAPQVGEQLRKMGAEPATGTPADFDRLVAAEVQRWGRLVKSARLRPD